MVDRGSEGNGLPLGHHPPAWCCQPGCEVASVTRSPIKRTERLRLDLWRYRIRGSRAEQESRSRVLKKRPALRTCTLKSLPGYECDPFLRLHADEEELEG